MHKGIKVADFVMASSRFKIDLEKFDGKENFIPWQQRIKDLLVQQRIYKV